MAADDMTVPGPAGAGRPALRSGAMPANRMNRDEFYAAMAPHDNAGLRKILWTVYWRGNAQLRERIEDELRPQSQPKVKARRESPDPVGVLDEVTTFTELARDGAYMAGDRRVHHTERSRWRHTFRRLAADALAALTASDPGPAQQAVAKIVDLACRRHPVGRTAAPAGPTARSRPGPRRSPWNTSRTRAGDAACG